LRHYLCQREYRGLSTDSSRFHHESGTLFPVEEMAELARSAGVMFHTDAVQAVGKIPID